MPNFHRAWTFFRKLIEFEVFWIGGIQELLAGVGTREHAKYKGITSKEPLRTKFYLTSEVFRNVLNTYV